jgi:hypothetical protein
MSLEKTVPTGDNILNKIIRKSAATVAQTVGIFRLTRSSFGHSDANSVEKGKTSSMAMTLQRKLKHKPQQSSTFFFFFFFFFKYCGLGREGKLFSCQHNMAADPKGYT